MAKPDRIELPEGTVIPILYEDRAVLAIDKPAGWLLAPDSWRRTSRNLQLALMSSLESGDHWARARNLHYIRFLHRLDADTSGVLLLAKNPGAVRAYSRLFEMRQVEKVYLAVTHGVPAEQDWVCRLKLAADSSQAGRTRVDTRRGQEAETRFHILQTSQETALVEATPVTGRTHQVRVHLAESGHPVLGDMLYNASAASRRAAIRNPPSFPLALRAVALSYPDPFQNRSVHISAPADEFCRHFGYRVVPYQGGSKRPQGR